MDVLVENLTFKRETELAVLFEDCDENEYWLPKSQIDYDEDCGVEDEVDVSMPEWLALEKGLI